MEMKFCPLCNICKVSAMNIMGWASIYFTIGERDEVL
jgi:hypothetical protein